MLNQSIYRMLLVPLAGFSLKHADDADGKDLRR